MTAAQRFLDTKSALRAPKLQNSLLNSLLAGNLRGDGCDQHCVASQAVSRSENMPNLLAERAGNGGLLRISHQSPGSDSRPSRNEIADNLQRTFEKLPFLGDRGQRPGLICTAWPRLQSNLPNSPPWSAPNWECRRGTAAPAAQFYLRRSIDLNRVLRFLIVRCRELPRGSAADPRHPIERTFHLTE